jgi:hypothetical protein
MKIIRKNLIGIVNLHISTIVLFNAGTVPTVIYIYIYIYIYKWAGWSKLLVYFIWVWATFFFGRKKSFRPKFQSQYIYVCNILI